MGLYEDIHSLLDREGVKYEEIRHVPARTSEEAASARGLPVSHGVKAMVLRSEGRFFLFALRAHMRIDWKKVRKILGTASVSLATPEEVKQVAGVEVGAVAPFGNLMGIPTYADESVYWKGAFDFSCGKHDRSIELRTDDWDRVVGPVRADFAIV